MEQNNINLPENKKDTKLENLWENYDSKPEKNTNNAIQNLGSQEVLQNHLRTNHGPDSNFPVFPGVFVPGWFSLSYPFSEYIAQLATGNVLVVGPGSGVDVVTGLNQKNGIIDKEDVNEIYFTDISHTAVSNTQLQIQNRLGLNKNKTDLDDTEAGALKDLFLINEKGKQSSPISFFKSDETRKKKFIYGEQGDLIPQGLDLISLDRVFWNAPFFPTKPGQEDRFPVARIDPGFSTLERFLARIYPYLNPDGLVTLMLSEFGSEQYRKLFDHYGFKIVHEDCMIATNVLGQTLPDEVKLKAPVITLAKKESKVAFPENVESLKAIIAKAPEELKANYPAAYRIPLNNI